MYFQPLPLLLLAVTIRASPSPTPLLTTSLTRPIVAQTTADPALIGWFTANHTWTSSACPSGRAYSTDGRFGGCCETAERGASRAPQCVLATGCADNVAVFPNGGSGVCRNTQQCESITIRNSATGAAAQTMISCIDTTAIFNAPNTLWRETFTITTPVETVTATATTTERKIETETVVEGGDDDSGVGRVGVGIVGVLAMVLAIF